MVLKLPKCGGTRCLVWTDPATPATFGPISDPFSACRQLLEARVKQRAVDTETSTVVLIIIMLFRTSFKTKLVTCRSWAESWQNTTKQYWLGQQERCNQLSWARNVQNGKEASKKPLYKSYHVLIWKKSKRSWGAFLWNRNLAWSLKDVACGS